MAFSFRVLLFAYLRDELGWEEKTFTCEDGITVGQIRDRLLPAAIREYLGPSIRLARNCEYVEAHTQISAGDEIALIPPVSGG